jgi:hypothetical protein
MLLAKRVFEFKGRGHWTIGTWYEGSAVARRF